MAAIPAWMLYTGAVAAGAAAGYVYHATVGCASGCVIWSSALNAAAYGALLGGLTLSALR